MSNHWMQICLILGLCVIASAQITSPKEHVSFVNELNGQFVNLYKQIKDKGFLIQFYSPWCHHCKQLEPIYQKVAEEVVFQNLSVYVARIDCTRYQNVAIEFDIKGFPTIMYVEADRMVEYYGDRNVQDILDFVKRISGPAVKIISKCSQLEQLKNQHRVFFVHFTDKDIWSNYSQAASVLHSTDWFYAAHLICPNYDPNSIYVIKSSLNKLNAQKYPLADLHSETPSHNLFEWMKVVRYPKVIRSSLANFYHLMNSDKIIVFLMLEHDAYSKDEKLNERELKYFNKLEQIANTMEPNPKVLFSYTVQVHLINSLLITTVAPLPAFVLINSTDSGYYVVAENDAHEHIESIVKSIIENSPDQPKFVGGNGFFVTLLRMLFDAYVSLCHMFRSNPILTSILLGLPICLISFLGYCACYTDFLEGEEEDFESEDEEFIDNPPVEQEHLKSD